MAAEPDGVRDHMAKRGTELKRTLRRGTGLGAVGVALPGGFLAAVVLLELVTPDWPCPFAPPLLSVVPALAAATSGIWGSAAFTALSVVVSFLLVQIEGMQDTGIFYAQIVGLVAIFLVSLVPGYLRSRRERTVRRLRSVAEVVREAALVPVPERDGCVQAYAEYLAADDEARMGGDLYDVLDTPYGVRMIMGDVRGKGLSAVASATNLLGAFREAAPYAPSLPELARRLDRSVRRHKRRAGLDTEEFTTAVLVSVPAAGRQAEVVSCGHPGPLLIRNGLVSEITSTRPWLPLGLGHLGPEEPQVDTADFDVGDRLLLYTDGVTEARDDGGAFYPLPERTRAWAEATPDRLVRHLVDDLGDHTGGGLGDDAAILVIQRVAVTAGPARGPDGSAAQAAPSVDGERPCARSGSGRDLAAGSGPGFGPGPAGDRDPGGPAAPPVRADRPVAGAARAVHATPGTDPPLTR